MGQIAYQHANSTYLELLDSPLKLRTPPTVDGVIPAWSDASTKSVAMAGSGFSGFDPATNLGVDFGTCACTSPSP